MPIFEYRCKSCGAEFERIEVSGEGPGRCKQCASPRVERVLSVFAVAGRASKSRFNEPGPCPCGAPRRGMCGE
jgi:putative FmdB family regulatory protein